jgi:hypothetical protein
MRAAKLVLVHSPDFILEAAARDENAALHFASHTLSMILMMTHDTHSA